MRRDETKMTNRFLPILFALIGVSEVHADGCEIVLPADIQQGSLVPARGPVGAVVRFQGRNLLVTDDGQFVFGVAYNAPTLMQLSVKAPTCQGVMRFPVQSRSYSVERVDGVPQNTVTPDPETAKRIAAEGVQIQQARALQTDALHWQGSLARPAVGRISGVYGSQRILNGQPSSPHLGLDIAAPTGTPVYAALPGRVTLMHQDMVMTGKTLLIDHGFGISTIYIHLSQIHVKLGEAVASGQKIAAIGTTGRSNGPHLHFQIHWFQEKLDPALLLSTMPNF
jgi:murein DD-endopeptidase MepM/ murein hydrolase activator NlpD